MKVTNKNKGQESKEKYVIKSLIGNKAFEKIMTTIRKYTVKLQKSNVDTRNGIIFMPTTPMYLEYTIISILLHIVIWTSVKSLSEQEPPLKIVDGKSSQKEARR